MSRQRELKQAYRDLADSVEAFLGKASWGIEFTSTLAEQAYQGMDYSYQHLRSIQDDLSGEAPASASDTSIAAAKSINPVGLRRLVLECIYGRWISTAGFTTGGMTCKEVEHQLRKSHESVSSAINYLRDSQLIRDVGERRRNPSGRKATVWVPTARGALMIANTPTREVTE